MSPACSPRPPATPLALGLTLLLAALPARAQTGPSFDCAGAESAAETLVCDDPALAALDRRLADRFAAALAVAGGMDAGAAAAVDTLRATQRGWIKGRDACWKADDLRVCVAEAYLRREGELVALWMLQAPVAVVEYACDGTPANTVTVHFFDTERPSVRLERGDTVDAGSLSPAASGARYEASFGRVFWQKGEAAVLIWPEGTRLDCVPQG